MPPATPADIPHASAIEDAIWRLLAARRDGATVCPSEVARSLATDEEGWRALMPQIRQVAQRLAQQHQLRVTRGGVVVDALDGRGPIRLGRPPKAPGPGPARG